MEENRHFLDFLEVFNNSLDFKTQNRKIKFIA
jgi:hypothetical protein